MGMSQMLLPEFDLEMANTRGMLERVPEDRLGWRPHPRSNTMAWLAGFIAVLPSWTLITLQQDSLDLAPGGVEPAPPAEPRSRAEILATFDRNRDAARAAIEAADDGRWTRPWSLLRDGRTLVTLPRLAVMRGFVMNHLIHHRGQLTVYFRLVDVPVPAIYGPTADERGEW